MISINLIRAHRSDAGEATHSKRPLAFLLGVFLLAAIHLVLAWHAAAVADRRETLRLEIARQQSARRRPETVSTSEAIPDPSHVQDVGRRLRRVAEAIPPDVWLTAYSERHGEAMMRAVALGDDAPRHFVENLAAASVFGRVEIIETVRQRTATDPREAKRAAVEFVLRAKLDLEGIAALDGGRG